MRRAKRQMQLKLTGREELRALWDSLAERGRKNLVEMYATLIAQSARDELQDEAKKKGGDDGRR